MGFQLVKWAKRGVFLLAALLLGVIGVRTFDSQRGPPLAPWHTHAPHELKAEALDRADWTAYLAAEDQAFARMRAEVTEKLSPDEQVPSNRYYAGSPVYPGSFARDWNRSYTLAPDGAPVGAVVLLHGLTDSPYSLRHIARSYRDHGYVVVAIRLPAHGLVPAALTEVAWPDWMAATRLAVREALRQAGPSAPLHIVGFSNGGALALKYALDAIEDPKLARPDRLVLISPMVGITSFARFAGIAGWPAFFPAFAKAAWLGIVPEFNPFKYNSFPVNGARQSWQVTQALQDQIARLADEKRLDSLAPILTFQSVIDFTVSTRTIVTGLYARLPANGSELVLFDLNRSAKFGPMLRIAPNITPERLLPPPPRLFATTVIANLSPDSSEAAERTTPAGAVEEQSRALGLAFPTGVFSLSHVALPFPLSDSLYGLEPDPTEDFGVHLGALSPRGERGTLIVSLDSLLRMSSNPFYPFMLERIEQTMLGQGRDKPVKATP
ncbi:alpha/beta hydrolase [uncultured Rhodoblastus sp.]|uniref:alpha/beta hydrolase n=1 Tax=uncultured Rhodoblastus sp. TaxID=543037 RepID=UPI0025F15C11|nr:alpha/beta hydrolase [uncultured Rhodoblastus sp.]